MPRKKLCFAVCQIDCFPIQSIFCKNLVYGRRHTSSQTNNQPNMVKIDVDVIADPVYEYWTHAFKNGRQQEAKLISNLEIYCPIIATHIRYVLVWSIYQWWLWWYFKVCRGGRRECLVANKWFKEKNHNTSGHRERQLQHQQHDQYLSNLSAPAQWLFSNSAVFAIGVGVW